MSTPASPAPTNTSVAESDLLRGLDRLEKLAKSQIVGALPGKSEKGTWSYDEEPVEPAEPCGSNHGHRIRRQRRPQQHRGHRAAADVAGTDEQHGVIH